MTLVNLEISKNGSKTQCVTGTSILLAFIDCKLRVTDQIIMLS